jgi:3-oxoadipate enol-lactonase
MSVPAIAITAPTGPADAPLLVLGPSLGTSTILWDAAAELLRTTHRVAAWDLPGHGRSPAAPSRFTVAEIALGVLDAVSALGEESFRYAGVSLGGAVGLELMLAAPERVEAAAIVCSGATIGTPEGWLERAAAVRGQGTASLVVASAARWFAPGSIELNPVIAGRLLHDLRDADDESYALCALALATYDVRARLASISAPVLAVWGEHDAVTPRHNAAEIAEGAPHGQLAMVADAAHLAPAEQPAAVAALLTAFFERTP